MTESPSEFPARRNQFLDHLLARFGEQFGEYALLLTNAAGDRVAQNLLIADKLAFLKAYPSISHDRGKAFDYAHAPWSQNNAPGIKKRINLLLGASAIERMIVVEHLLLRPKFIGDALYPACSEGGCSTCGDEDPYSFRLSFVMPGWTVEYTDNLDMRRFVERTIQQEERRTHLLGKTCWVGNDGFIKNPCDEVIGQVADLLIAEGLKARRHSAG